MVDNINVDSLIANEFAVEINGEPMSGVFSVSGLVSFMLECDPRPPATQWWAVAQHSTNQKDVNEGEFRAHEMRPMILQI